MHHRLLEAMGSCGRFGHDAVVRVPSIRTRRFLDEDPDQHVVVIFQEERFVRPLFRNLSLRQEIMTAQSILGGAKEGTPRVNSLESAGPLTNNPNGANPFRIDRSNPIRATRGPRLRRRTVCVSRRTDGSLHRHSAKRAVPSAAKNKNLGPNSTLGYYRRQYRNRALVLRTALRDERQLLQHDLWAVDAGPSEPGRGQHLRRQITNGPEPVEILRELRLAVP